MKTLHIILQDGTEIKLKSKDIWCCISSAGSLLIYHGDKMNCGYNNWKFFEIIEG